jgi:hypothetical protein
LIMRISRNFNQEGATHRRARPEPATTNA